MLVSLLFLLLHLLSTHLHLCKTDGGRLLLWDMGFDTWLPGLEAREGYGAYVSGTLGEAPENLPGDSVDKRLELPPRESEVGHHTILRAENHSLTEATC